MNPGMTLALLIALTSLAAGQPASSASAMAGAHPDTTAWTTADDHEHMLATLGIRALRLGPSGREGAPNRANYDEAIANPYPRLPDVLTLDAGRRVTSAEMWQRLRRPEIVEAFEREVYGRIPAGVPGVAWSVAEESTGTLAGRPVRGRRLVGRADNSAHPAIDVEIDLVLVLPADAPAPVPVMIMFRDGSLPQAMGVAPTTGPGGASVTPQPGADPPATEQLITSGWGFAFLRPASIQADNGAGLTRGIIGLTNQGRPRTPEDWGSLRAWSWGAARTLDYLETDLQVDAKRVGIEGVSRYGKAALVTMAFEPRFAVGLIGSSGAGGRQAVPSSFRRSHREPDRLGPVSLDGRELPQVRRRGGDVREQERQPPSPWTAIN